MKAKLRILGLVAALACWGAVAQAGISAVPSFVSFGTVQVNGIFHSQSVSIYNFGPDAVSLSVQDTCPLDISIQTFSCFGSLNANQSCSYQIQYQPKTEGSFTCQMYVSSLMGGFQSISITGQAQNPL